MNGILLKFRDWWRGYSDEDVESLWRKLDANKKPGKITRLTRREYRAFVDQWKKCWRGC